MNKNRKNILLLLLFLIPISVFAQPSRIEFRQRLDDSIKVINIAEEPEKVKLDPVLKSEISAGIKLSTDGYGLILNKGFIKDANKYGRVNRDKLFRVNLIQLEISEIRHPKEISSTSSMPGMNFSTDAYKLGKINTFYQVNLGYGKKKLIAGKPDPGTISIHWLYLGGFSAALLKPYYLNLQSSGDTKYDEENETYFISPGNIIGKSSFTKGFDELKFIPGGFLKTGLHFDFAKKRKGLGSLEVGILASYYSEEIELMVRQKPSQFFFNFYAAVFIGKRN